MVGDETRESYPTLLRPGQQLFDCSLLPVQGHVFGLKNLEGIALVTQLAKSIDTPEEAFEAGIQAVVGESISRRGSDLIGIHRRIFSFGSIGRKLGGVSSSHHTTTTRTRWYQFWP